MDHNKLKNITLDKANKLKIQTARFPLDEYIQLKTSAILSINHTYELLIRVYNGQTWAQAVEATIPLRKIKEKDAPDEEAPGLSESSSASASRESDDDEEEEEISEK